MIGNGSKPRLIAVLTVVWTVVLYYPLAVQFVTSLYTRTIFVHTSGYISHYSEVKKEYGRIPADYRMISRQIRWLSYGPNHLRIAVRFPGQPRDSYVFRSIPTTIDGSASHPVGTQDSFPEGKRADMSSRLLIPI